MGRRKKHLVRGALAVYYRLETYMSGEDFVIIARVGLRFNF